MSASFDDEGYGDGSGGGGAGKALPDADKKRRRYDQAENHIVRGTKLKLLSVKPAQAKTFDGWRHVARKLWNLLLGMEAAAYSGEKYMAEVFDWRSIWADVVQGQYDRDLVDFQQGGRRKKDGSLRKGSRKMTEPAPVSADYLARIRGHGFDPSLGADGEPLADGARSFEPRVFIWERDLNAIMARLKHEPATMWIGDLHSHGCQRVVTDLVKAIRAMLREREKKAQGQAARNWGFPRFKANRYAEGSVYFANTQMKVDWERSRVLFPAGVGWIKCESLSNIPRDSKLMGARLWRQGETWWLSPQFETPLPRAPKSTGKQAGVKVAAGVLATIVDGETVRQIHGHREDKRFQRRLKLWNRRLARRREAQTEKALKIARRTSTHKGAGRVRLKRSSGFYEASASLARMYAREANQKNDILQKASRLIVDKYDHITIEGLDVAGMVSRRSAKRQWRAIRKRWALRNGGTAADGVAAPADAASVPGIEHKAPAKVLRKSVRRAAMSRFLDNIKYKAEWGGRTVTEGHVYDPRVQKCNGCGHLNMVMKDGRQRHKCDKCGSMMRRNENAAENQYASGKLSREASGKV